MRRAPVIKASYLTKSAFDHGRAEVGLQSPGISVDLDVCLVHKVGRPTS